MTKRAAIYCRISSDPKERRLGVERQEQDCRELAGRLGWTVTEVYTDNDMSASKGKFRPAFNRMMKDAEQGKADAVLVTKIDRLTRSLAEFSTFMDWIDQHKVSFATTEGDNTDTESGQTILGIKAVMARGEARRIRERVRRSMVQHAEQGKPRRGGDRPYGYDQSGERDTIIAEEARVIRELKDRLLAGESLRSLSFDLEKRGITSVAGGAWTAATIRRMILRPRHAGLRQHIVDGVVNVYPAQWDAIVTVEEHERLVALFTDPARKQKAGRKPEYLGSGGLYVCECGGNLTGRRRDGQACYQCANRPGAVNCGRRRRAAAAIDQYVKETVLTPEIWEQFDRAFAKHHQVDEKQVSGARNDLADATRRLHDLEKKYALGDLSRAVYQEARVELNDRARKAQDRLDKLTAHKQILALPSGVEEARKLWDSKDVDWQRSLLQTFVSKVTVLGVQIDKRGSKVFDPSRILIDWRF